MEQVDESAILNKGGEIVVEIRFRRNASGLMIGARTVPAIEDFMRGLGDGSAVDVRAAGRLWVPLCGDTLMAYAMTTGFPGENSHEFELTQLGKPIINNYNSKDGGLLSLPLHAGSTANLSFLRLVGISEGEGVTFGVKGVYSLDFIRSMRDQVLDACRKFYVTYLKPIDFCVQISTQEIPAK